VLVQTWGDAGGEDGLELCVQENEIPLCVTEHNVLIVGTVDDVGVTVVTHRESSCFMDGFGELAHVPH
jgi:hypothetical protein